MTNDAQAAAAEMRERAAKVAEKEGYHPDADVQAARYRQGCNIARAIRALPIEDAPTPPPAPEITVAQAAQRLLDARNRDGMTVLTDYVRHMLRALIDEARNDAGK